jgi:tetratricopeptide (TPR) repeat protein
MDLLQNDIASAEQATGNSILQSTSIPYARYTIFVCLANIELAVAKKEFDQALRLSNELLDEVTPLTSVDIPEVLRWKAAALDGLGRVPEAYSVLTEACERARDSGSKLQLWAILSHLSALDSRLGNRKEAEANREEAQRVVEQIAESLREVGLRDRFLNQPRIQKLMQ